MFTRLLYRFDGYYVEYYMIHGYYPGWNPSKPYAEDAPVVVKRHAKVTNDAKLYLPPS